MWPFGRKAQSATAEVAGSGSGTARVLTFISPYESEALGGIPWEAVVGEFSGGPGDMSVESFRPNPAFVAFLHETIRLWGPRDPELRASARSHSNGWIYIIDLRTPEGPLGRVPPEDIIGAFQVAGGEIVEGSYERCATHRVYTHNGMCQLPGALTQAFVRRLLPVS